jgi:hypothetical protein
MWKAWIATDAGMTGGIPTGKPVDCGIFQSEKEAFEAAYTAFKSCKDAICFSVKAV